MAKGVSTRGDVLVNETADGVNLNDIWEEIQDVLELYNAERSAFTSLLSYRTIQVADAVPQSVSSDSFEEATEAGIPRAIRPPSDVLRLGYNFKDWDLRAAFTWKFLRAATAEQVTASVTRPATFAVLQLSAGTHFMQVSKWLGHVTYTLTLDVYGDYIPEEDGGAANNLPEPPAPAIRTERATNVIPLRRRV